MDTGTGDDGAGDGLAAFPWAAGVVTGTGTFLGSYVGFTAILAALGSIDFSHSVPTVLRHSGLAFYNALNIPSYEKRTLVVDGNASGRTEYVTETWANAVTGWQRTREAIVKDGRVVQEASSVDSVDPGTAIPPEIYLLLPVVGLLAVGAVFAVRFPNDGDARTPRTLAIRSVQVGAALALGYLLVALLGTYVLVSHGSAGQSVLRPARFEALVYGLLYGVGFTAVAGALAMWIRRRRTVESG